MKNSKNKNILLWLIVIGLGCLFIYSAINICTFIFGSKREIYIQEKEEIYVNSDDNLQNGFAYYIWYNNGKKMVTERVHLSILELMQREKNSGYITFKQLGTFITHRSAFIYSSIYFVLFIVILYFNLKRDK